MESLLVWTNFIYINPGRWDEAGKWDEIFIHTTSNFAELVSTQHGRWGDFLHIQLEVGIECA